MKALILWNGGAELSAWHVIHEAERLAVDIMAPAHLQGRLKRAQGDAAELPDARASIWKETLETLLKELEKNSGDLAQARGLLAAFLADLYETRDSRFAWIVRMQNLIAFLILVGLWLGLGLMLVGYGPILLAGAVGALLGRLLRAGEFQPRGNDYGLSWMLAFPTPLVGVFAAWTGLHLLALLKNNLVALGEMTLSLKPPIRFDEGTIPLLALGAFFGLSERWTDKLAEKVHQLLQKPERKEGEKREKQEPVPASSPLEGAGRVSWEVARMRLDLRREAPPASSGGQGNGSPPTSGGGGRE